MNEDKSPENVQQEEPVSPQTESARQQNVDYQEVGKFNKNPNWWDKDGEFKPLHDINPLRLEYVRSQLQALTKSSLQGKKILDVGCGGGIFAESLAAAGAQVDGIDLAEEALQTAKLHLLESGLSVNYHLSSIEDFAQNNAGQYDVVTCLEMLEHVPDPYSVINACQHCLKPGGIMFLSTLNRTAKSYLFAIVGAEHILRILPQGTHDHKKFIKPSEIDNWARKLGLDIRHLTGMHYNPLTKHYWLADGLDVNYLVCLQKAGTVQQ